MSEGWAVGLVPFTARWGDMADALLDDMTARICAALVELRDARAATDTEQASETATAERARI